MRFEYLLFNLFVIIGPIIFILFGKKAPKFKPSIIAVIIPAIIFIIWDAIVSGYFWWFNDLYITGIHIYTLPIQEVLFFFTVPYACLYIWGHLDIKGKTKNLIAPYILLLVGFVIIFSGKYYTAIVLIALGLVLFIDKYLKTNIFRMKKTYYFLLILVFLTLIFNGYLTARPVVLYNELLKTNINIFTIPIEDFIYSISLIAFVIIIYEKLRIK